MANGNKAVGPTLDSDDEAALLRPLAFAEGGVCHLPCGWSWHVPCRVTRGRLRT